MPLSGLGFLSGKLNWYCCQAVVEDVSKRWTTGSGRVGTRVKNPDPVPSLASTRSVEFGHVTSLTTPPRDLSFALSDVSAKTFHVSRVDSIPKRDRNFWVDEHCLSLCRFVPTYIGHLSGNQSVCLYLSEWCRRRRGQSDHVTAVSLVWH